MYKITYQRTDSGWIGYLKTSLTFLLARGTSKKEVKQEITEALMSF